MGHFSFGVFLLDFWVFSEPQAQSLVASIAVDLASITLHTKSAFFLVFAIRHVHFVEYLAQKCHRHVIGAAFLS